METVLMSKSSFAQQRMGPAQKELVVIEAKKKAIVRGAGIFWLFSTVFIFLRFFLEAIGSDPQSFFVSLIYVISSIFLFPFFGIFPHLRSVLQPGEPTFDPMALTAIFCYTILVLLTIGVAPLTARIFKTRKHVKETVDNDQIIDPTVAEKIIK